MTRWNILQHEIEDVAEGIKLRMMATNATMAVYVGPDGAVLTERVKGRSRDLPDSWLIGCYTRSTPCADLEDDLVVRLGELGRKAA